MKLLSWMKARMKKSTPSATEATSESPSRLRSTTTESPTSEARGKTVQKPEGFGRQRLSDARAVLRYSPKLSTTESPTSEATGSKKNQTFGFESECYSEKTGAGHF